jgi:hypothetical protein
MPFPRMTTGGGGGALVAVGGLTGRAGTIVRGAEVAADYRALADQLEHVGRLIRALKLLGRPPFVADVDERAEKQGEAGKGAAAFAPVEEVEARDARRPRPCIEHSERDDPLRFAERQAANQHRVDDREHRRVHADAQRQRRRRDRREPAILDEQPRGVAKVLPQGHRGPSVRDLRHRSRTVGLRQRG